MGEVAFQQWPVDVGERVDADEGQEVAEPDQGIDSGAGRADAEPGRQAEPGPSFAQIAQSGMDDAVEPQPVSRTRAPGRRGDAGQPVQPPDIPGIFVLPAGSVSQGLDRVAGVEQEDQRLIGASRSRHAPLFFAQLQQ